MHPALDLYLSSCGPLLHVVLCPSCPGFSYAGPLQIFCTDTHASLVPSFSAWFISENTKVHRFVFRSDQIRSRIQGYVITIPSRSRLFSSWFTFSPWSTSVLCWLGVWTTTLLGQLPINRNLNNILDYLSICILFCLAEGYKCISINDAMLTKAR